MPQISVLAISCAFALTGLVVQVTNNFVDTWSVSTLFVLIFCLVPIFSLITTWALGAKSRQPKQHKLQTLKPSLFLLGVLLSLYVVLRFGTTISFLHLVAGEDNSKWINGISNLLNGNITAGDTNGISAPLVLLLLVVAYLLRLLSSFYRFDMSTTEIAILTPFVTEILLMLAFVFIQRYQSKIESGSIHPIQRHYQFESQSMLTVQILALLILLNTSSFGFLTFSFAFLVISMIAKILPSISDQNEPRHKSRVVLALLLFVCASFIWLPLSILLTPVVLLLFATLSKQLIRSGQWRVIYFLAVASSFIGYKVILPRFRYFFTEGSGGQLNWRELALSGGGTPKITTALLICAALIVAYKFYHVAESEFRSSFSFAIAATLLITYSGITIVAGSLGNLEGYASSKIGLFVLLSILVLLAELPAQSPVRFKTRGLTFLIVLVLSFSGDLALTYNRVVDPLTISRLEEVHAKWVRAVTDELDNTGTAPVGCLTITSTGSLVRPENARDYLCTRILTNLAGGEERLIGLHAFTTGVFNAAQMYGSLEHYLGTSLDEKVLLFSQDTDQLVQRVSLQELKKFVDLSS